MCKSIVRFFQENKILLLISLLAFILRIFLIRVGLPLLVYEDEPIYFNHALGFGLGIWKLGYFKKPSFFLFFYNLFYLLSYCIGNIIHGHWISWRAFVQAFWINPTQVALVGRSVSVIFATASVFLTGKLGERTFGRCAGLAAAFFLAINTSHLIHSPIVISDIPSLFFILASAWFALNVSENGRWRDYLLCAFMIALTMSFKYNFFSAAFLIIAHGIFCHTKILNYSFRQQIKIYLFDPKFLISLALIPCLFLVLNPTILMDFPTFLADFNRERRHMLVRDPAFIHAHWKPMVAFSRVFLRILPEGQGWFLYIAALVGGLWGLWKAETRRQSMILLSFPLVFALTLSQFLLLNAKYLLPLMPFDFLMAGLFLQTCMQYGGDWFAPPPTLTLPPCGGGYFKPSLMNWKCISSFLSIKSELKSPPPLRGRVKVGGKYLPMIDSNAIIGSILILTLSSWSWLQTAQAFLIRLQPDTRLMALHLLETLPYKLHDRLLLEPDTLTLNNRLFRSMIVIGEVVSKPLSKFEYKHTFLVPNRIFKPKNGVRFNLTSHSIDEIFSLHLPEFHPRYVLINWEKVQTTQNASGETICQIPLYFIELRQNYHLQAMITPYPSSTDITAFDHVLKSKGWTALYEAIDNQASRRRQLGPTMLLMVRDS